MKLQDLQRIVLLLSNQGWTRYWVHWNYPQRSPWKMAISFSLPRDEKQFGSNLKRVLAKQGFTFETRGDSGFAVIERDRMEVADDRS